jgi:parallel beta-helix repeat protein
MRVGAGYGAFVKDSAEVSMEGCEVSYCSESAIFMRDAGSITLRNCQLSACHVGVTAGEACSGQLEVDACCSVHDVRRPWYDDDRPPRMICHLSMLA